MKRTLTLLAVMTLCLRAALPTASVVAHDAPYYTEEVRNTELIFTQGNRAFAQEAAEVEWVLNPLYETLYGYTMDEQLHVVLASEYNQIANGFSTQYPNNRQVNYIGGVLKPDYFASPSWLKTLLYHETAHNYQMNAKDNAVSSTLHTVIGNGAFYVPWFAVPNIVESSFLIEGNAVLNESWHGNGGRLYSGRFKAATLQQAKAGYLTPERVYNDNYYFLYGSHFYTLGGYYQYYLAEQYGLKRVNGYWQEHTHEWFWPFFTNNATERAVGVDFDASFDAWRKKMEAEAAELTDVEGEALASTQFFSALNDDEEEIYFIINESGREFPELVVFDKADGTMRKTPTSHIAGKVVNLGDNAYVTQAGVHTNPWRIYMGLYDKNALIVEGTESKVIEGYLGDGRAVYFDVPTSFDQPQLFVGNAFYGRVNSSVFIDRATDDLYYFVQGEAKERSLYRNQEKLFTLNSYYGHVCGVDTEGDVYFIANTPHGSGLFRFHKGKITRAHPADTIFDARLIDDGHALAAVMEADAYAFKRITLDTIEEAPHEVLLFVESEPCYRADDTALHRETAPEVGLDNPYYSLLAMNYSATNLFFGSDSNAGFLYSVDINFADPLTQNALSLFLTRNLDEYTLGGAGYSNIQYFIQFSVSGYGVIDRPDLNDTLPDEKREFGLVAQAQLPFWQQGHYYGALRGAYYQDYERFSREPLSAALELMRTEQYGVSAYPNFLLRATPYVSGDRGDLAYGAEAAFGYGLPYEFYFGLDGQYSVSDAETPAKSRGVKLAKTVIERFADSDPTTVVMPGLRNTAYLKSIGKASLSLKKVLNGAAYFFTFPVSLRRETLYTGYSRYVLEPFGQQVDNESVNQAIAGIAFDTFWMNKLPIPIAFEYIYNDNENEVLADEHTFRFNFGLTF